MRALAWVCRVHWCSLGSLGHALVVGFVGFVRSSSVGRVYSGRAFVFVGFIRARHWSRRVHLGSLGSFVARPGGRWVHSVSLCSFGHV